MRYPTIKDLSALIRAIKADADRDGLDLTIGADGYSWSFQTGDNSFTGGAYGYRHWAVTTVYKRSDSRALARDLIGQLRDLIEG